MTGDFSYCEKDLPCVRSGGQVITGTVKTTARVCAEVCHWKVVFFCWFWVFEAVVVDSA